MIGLITSFYRENKIVYQYNILKPISIEQLNSIFVDNFLSLKI